MASLWNYFLQILSRMQRSTSPTIELVSEKPVVDSVARGICNGLEVAVKKIPHQLLSIEDDITKLLTQLDHENVMKIFAVDNDGTRFSPPGSTTSSFFLPVIHTGMLI